MKIPVRLAQPFRDLRFALGSRGHPLTGNERRLAVLRDRYRGRRCFVIGNGPSLERMDLSPLKNEVTIGCNGLFLMFDRMGFIPTFYTCEDGLVAEDRAKELNALAGTTKVWPVDLSYCLEPGADTVYCNFTRRYGGFPKFSDDFARRVYWGGTVTFMNLQLARFIGASEIYLVGIDHNYRGPKNGDSQSGFVITAGTPDTNHFHPDYFGPGYRYHDPNVARMEQAYVEARTFLGSRNIKVFNATAGGKLDVFPRFEFVSLFTRSAATAKSMNATSR